MKRDFVQRVHDYIMLHTTSGDRLRWDWNKIVDLLNQPMADVPPEDKGMNLADWEIASANILCVGEIVRKEMNGPDLRVVHKGKKGDEIILQFMNGKEGLNFTEVFPPLFVFFRRRIFRWGGIPAEPERRTSHYYEIFAHIQTVREKLRGFPNEFRQSIEEGLHSLRRIEEEIKKHGLVTFSSGEVFKRIHAVDLEPTMTVIWGSEMWINSKETNYETGKVILVLADPHAQELRREVVRINQWVYAKREE